ncbi:MAG: hypothetical protein HYZ28_10520 [Myxococcales bacterium]|nr:hypothetical protein [Myxococcales bacterium]
MLGQAMGPTEPTAGQAAPAGGRRLFVPWGLLLALGVYATAVLWYIQHTYWSSPEYQAAVHLYRAQEILGVDGGRKAPRERMLEAYQHLLEAARLMPQVKELHELLERLNWRFEERKLGLPSELRLRAEAVAAVWQRIQRERQPILVVGVRDRGWAPDQLAEGPGRAFRWSLLGVLLIVVAWGYGRFNEKRSRERKREEEIRAMEREVEELAGQREKLRGREERRRR